MLNDATMWRFRYSRLFKAVNNDPIAPFDIHKTLTKSPILISCESQEAKASWYFAGNLTIYSDLGIVDRVQLARVRMPVNRPLLIDLPKANEGLIYKLNFVPVPWHKEISITVWESI